MSIGIYLYDKHDHTMTSFLWLVIPKNSYKSNAYSKNDKLMHNDKDFLLFTGVHASRVIYPFYYYSLYTSITSH